MCWNNQPIFLRREGVAEEAEHEGVCKTGGPFLQPLRWGALWAFYSADPLFVATLSDLHQHHPFGVCFVVEVGP